VLSDPTQRQRYDERLADWRDGGDDDEYDEDDEDDEYEDDDEGEDERPVRSERAARPARPAPGTRAQRREEMRRARKEQMSATITLPNGQTLAPVRNRLMALATDAVILLALFSAVQLIGANQVDRRFPGERTHASHLQKRVDALNDTISADKKAVSAAQDKKDAAAEKAAKDKQAADQKRHDAYNDQIDAINRDFAPGLKTVFAIGVLVAFLYLVPMTALTGQTIGKRMQKIRVVKAGDGSVPGWAVSAKRFAVPLGIALVLGVLFLGEFALALGMVAIVGWVNRPDRQGMHDRLARTVVVEA
jgi:hypothetical protein